MLLMSRAIMAYARPGEDDYDVTCLDDHADRDGFLRTHGAEYEAVLAAGMERLDAERLALLPNLKLISVIAAGMAGIDLDAAQARGVAVTNAGDINAGDVADYAVAMMLTQARDVVANDAYVRSGAWVQKRLPPGRSIASQKVGIVGLGHIGKAIARRMEPFGCDIAWWGPNPKDVAWPRMDSIEALATWCTTLFVAAAGNDDTRGLITAEVIDRLGPRGLIVNVSRGFVIDEPAMKAALVAGRLGAAALDVFDHEPIDGSDWADVPNMLMAPHVAGATSRALGLVGAGALDNIRRLFAGEPLERRVV